MSVNPLVNQTVHADNAIATISIGHGDAELRFASQVARNAQENDLVYALRYRAYRAEGYIPENPAARFFDDYDFESANRSFLTYCNGQLIGSVRACVSSPKLGEHLPAAEIYEQELAAEVGFDKVIVESNKFVFEPGFRQAGGLAARLILVRNVLNYAVSLEADVIVTAVRKSHARLYKSFGFRQISEAKRYPLLDFDTILMCCDDLGVAAQFIESKLRS